MKTNTIIQGNALQELKKLPKKSINMCMTSPPYWALRDYGTDVETIFDGDKNCEHDFAIVENKNPADRGGHSQFDEEGMGATIGVKNTTKNIKSGFCNKCQAWKGQLGLEPTFDLYIKHLCDIFDEVKRVLRDDGTCWVNLGDTYAGSGQGHKEEHFWNEDGTPKNKFAYKRGAGLGAGIPKVKDWKLNNIPDKCLVMIPFRFAIEMVNRGWILRNTIIWHKRNCMPSSVKDRFTVDFEYLFFFSKKKKYSFETIYEPIAESTLNDRRLNKGAFEYHGKREGVEGIQNRMCGMNSQGRNKRCVWTINPKPFKESHFAVYPEELCETPIRAGCPEFVCVKCGNPKVKIFKIKKEATRPGNTSKYENFDTKWSPGGNESMRKRMIVVERNLIENKPTCSCNTNFTGGIVLDPFFGAGTTGLVALKQNKKFIGIELNKEYIEIAKKRLKPYLEQEKLL